MNRKKAFFLFTLIFLKLIIHKRIFGIKKKPRSFLRNVGEQSPAFQSAQPRLRNLERVSCGRTILVVSELREFLFFIPRSGRRRLIAIVAGPPQRQSYIALAFFILGNKSLADPREPAKTILRRFSADFPVITRGMSTWNSATQLTQRTTFSIAYYKTLSSLSPFC